MKIIKKVLIGISGFEALITASVAVKNAIESKSDAEVGHAQSFYERYIKRPQDFLWSSVLLLGISPLFVGTALIVKKKLGTPVLFTQKRPGKNEEIFNLIKFRSMTDEKDKNGNLLPDEQRLTSFGRLLRKSSLDELPELVNIMKGDMSFIGPRPLLDRYLDYYYPEERARHSVRPGLTGLAQINGRNALAWDERLALDVKYVNNITFTGDIKILLKTIVKVIKSEDIVDAGSFEMKDLDEERKARYDDNHA